MNVARASILVGALAGAAAVATGAFGAHALRASLDAEALAIWRTAVEYQFWHALALLAVGLIARIESSVALNVAALAFALGIVLFCGSLYALALGAPRPVGVATPIGGVGLIVGWAALAVHAFRSRAD
ncbi:MAG TPA: DUF423 domain-containing protein [Rhodanobacteraceae bacterium]